MDLRQKNTEFIRSVRDMVSIPSTASAEFERYAGLACRSLFLHFINRELIGLRGLKLTESEHISAMKNCGLMTAGNIVAPFAQASELYWRSKNMNALIAQLCLIDKLHLCNGATDCYSFLESRKSLYSAHKNKYGMYFGKKAPSHSFRPSPVLRTTEYIKSTLLQSITDPNKAPNILSHSEIDRLRLNSNFIRNEFQDNPYAATYTVYEAASIAPKPDETRFFGAVSSRLFAHHYSSTHDLITPTGFFYDIKIESFDLFPLFDLELNSALIDRLDLHRVVNDTEFHNPYLNLILDRDFTEFCRIRIEFIQALIRSIGGNIGDGSNHNYRLMARLRELDFGPPQRSAPQRAAVLIERLISVMKRAAQSDRNFALAMESTLMKQTISRPILLFTATDLEDESLRANLAVRGYERIDVRTLTGFTGAIYKGGGNISLWHVRTSAGSSGTHGSARISELAIDQIKPAFVFSVGVAFGVDERKQKLGDVLVSEYVFSYERSKFQDGRIEWRGDKVPCSPDAVSFSRQYGHFDSSFRVVAGGILSGDKLVDDAEFRSALEALDPKSIGGEMEAAGLAQSCGVKHAPFAMIKGICDFAVGKDDSAQELAARNAFAVAFHMIEAFNKAGAFGV